MSDPVTRVIDGCTYTLTALGTRAGISVGARLTKMLGSAGASPENPVAAIMGALDEKDLLYLTDLFAKLTLVTMPDGKQPILANVFDTHFEKKYGNMVLWLIFCLETNFSELFQTLKTELPRILSQYGA
jgi:hypothetical protein